MEFHFAIEYQLSLTGCYFYSFIYLPLQAAFETVQNSHLLVTTMHQLAMLPQG